jgi:hypothetical protein
MGRVTVAGLRPGDVVLGWMVLRNDPSVGTDGGITHHALKLRGPDGQVEVTLLSRGRRFDIDRRG